MSNNTKHTPWDPGLVSWVSKVLCLIPDSSYSLGLSHAWTCVCMRIPSIAAPILPDTDQLWTLLVYLSGQSSSLSAADLVCLSGEELGQCCGCSSSFSAANLMPLSGEELVHRCHHVSVQINIWCVVLCMLLVQPLLSSAGYRYKYCSTGECTSAGVYVGLLCVVAALT